MYKEYNAWWHWVYWKNCLLVLGPVLRSLYVNQIRMVSEFRKLNVNLLQTLHPIPKISDIMKKLEGFQYATALELNMGYYTIRLDPWSQYMCTIITPWGKYKYIRLPMSIVCAPDIFQEKMSNLMEGLEFARTYTEDLMCLSKGNFNEDLKDVEKS